MSPPITYDLLVWVDRISRIRSLKISYLSIKERSLQTRSMVGQYFLASISLIGWG